MEVSNEIFLKKKIYRKVSKWEKEGEDEHTLQERNMLWVEFFKENEPLIPFDHWEMPQLANHNHIVP